MSEYEKSRVAPWKLAQVLRNCWQLPVVAFQLAPAVFSDVTNRAYCPPAYEAQNDAMDKHMEKYNLQDQDWRPGLTGKMKANNQKENLVFVLRSLGKNISVLLRFQYRLTSCTPESFTVGPEIVVCTKNLRVVGIDYIQGEND